MFVSQQSQILAAALQPGCEGGLFLLERFVSLFMAYHSQTRMFPLLFQSPWPTSSDYGQSDRPKAIFSGSESQERGSSRSCRSEGLAENRHKSYQCTSQARGYYQANGRAICHNWYRSLKETPLALPLKSQGLAGQILFQLEAANLIKG